MKNKLKKLKLRKQEKKVSTQKKQHFVLTVYRYAIIPAP